MDLAIQLNQEQQNLLNQAIKAGVVKNVQESLDLGFNEVRRLLKAAASKPAAKQNLAEFFRNSPLYGVDLNLDREKSLL